MEGHFRFRVSFVRKPGWPHDPPRPSRVPGGFHWRTIFSCDGKNRSFLPAKYFIEPPCDSAGCFEEFPRAIDANAFGGCREDLVLLPLVSSFITARYCFRPPPTFCQIENPPHPLKTDRSSPHAATKLENPTRGTKGKRIPGSVFANRKKAMHLPQKVARAHLAKKVSLKRNGRRKTSRAPRGHWNGPGHGEKPNPNPHGPALKTATAKKKLGKTFGGEG